MQCSSQRQCCPSRLYGRYQLPGKAKPSTSSTSKSTIGRLPPKRKKLKKPAVWVLLLLLLIFCPVLSCAVQSVCVSVLCVLTLCVQYLIRDGERWRVPLTISFSFSSSSSLNLSASSALFLFLSPSLCSCTSISPTALIWCWWRWSLVPLSVHYTRSVLFAVTITSISNNSNWCTVVQISTARGKGFIWCMRHEVDIHGQKTFASAKWLLFHSSSFSLKSVLVNLPPSLSSTFLTLTLLTHVISTVGGFPPASPLIWTNDYTALLAPVFSPGHGPPSFRNIQQSPRPCGAFLPGESADSADRRCGSRLSLSLPS